MCNCNREIQLTFKKLDQRAIIPEYKTSGASGMDISTIEEYTLEPLERHIFKTGLASELEEGYELQVRPRSGMACKSGVTVINTPGTLDSDYRGEIGVCLINLTNESVKIEAGTRVAQLVLSKVERAAISLSETLSSTERGNGGFGSTGVK